jgi:hypothetical protein
LFYSPSSERKNHLSASAVLLAICVFNCFGVSIVSKDMRRSEHLAQVTLRSFACSIRSYTSWSYLCLLGIDIHYSLRVQYRFSQMRTDCRNSQGFFSMCLLLLTLTLYVLSWHLEVIHRSSLLSHVVRERWCRSRLALARCGKKTQHGGGSRLHEPMHAFRLD